MTNLAVWLVFLLPGVISAVWLWHLAGRRNQPQALWALLGLFAPLIAWPAFFWKTSPEKQRGPNAAAAFGGASLALLLGIVLATTLLPSRGPQNNAFTLARAEEAPRVSQGSSAVQEQPSTALQEGGKNPSVKAENEETMRLVFASLFDRELRNNGSSGKAYTSGAQNRILVIEHPLGGKPMANYFETSPESQEFLSLLKSHGFQQVEYINTSTGEVASSQL